MAPSGPQLSPGPAAGRALHPWLVVLALAPGILLTLADATVMTITVQAIIRQVGGSVVSVSWVMNGYNLVLTVLFLPMGRLGDRYGHKLVFTLGLAVFTAASLPCALATSVPELVAWRVVQAVGAAAVVPTALALLLQAFPERRQGLAAGLFGAVSSLALAVGPVLGGVLVWYRGWPAVFWLNLPVGILGVILVLTLTTGPAHAAHPRVPRLARRRARQRRALLRHAGDHPGQRLGLGLGRRHRSLRRRRRPPPRLGLVGAADALSPVRPPPLP